MCEMRPLLRVSRMSKTWGAPDGEFEVRLDALDVAQGDAFALLGESGSGKSTLLDMLALTSAPDDGTAFEFSPDGVNLIDVARLWRERERDWLALIRGQFFGYVLQTGGLLPFLTVYDNIALPQQVSGRRDQALIKTLAERLDIGSQLDKRPAALSVGQRQRVAIARALSHRPRLVLADEPTAAVQATLAAEIMSLLVEQVTEFGAALLMATHSPELVKLHPMVILSASLQPDEGSVRSTFTRESQPTMTLQQRT